MGNGKQVAYSCVPQKYLVGWDEIAAHLEDIGAKKLASLSSSELQEYATEHGFPSFVTRYGKVAANTILIRHWLNDLELD